MRKPQRTGSPTRREKANQEKHQRRQKKQIQRRPLRAQRAQVDPQPVPQARGFFVQQIWDKLGLEEALERVGIGKDGLPISTILMVVLLMGVVGATSLNGLTVLPCLADRTGCPTMRPCAPC